MTIRDLIDSGITIQGNVRVELYIDDEPLILFHDDFDRFYEQKDDYFSFLKIYYMYAVATADSAEFVIEVKEN